MRQRLNDNPIVQIAFVGVLLAAAALLLVVPRHKSDSSASTPATTDSAAPAAAPAAPTSDTAPAAPETATSSAPVAANAAVPPLPAPVLDAYRRGETVALLVVRGGGIDDKLVHRSVAGLRSVASVALFVARADHIARYSEITRGAGVDRVPALVVVRPRPLNSGPAVATVRYGFQGAQSVIQAVQDAIYHGPTVGYSPD